MESFWTRFIRWDIITPLPESSFCFELLSFDSLSLFVWETHLHLLHLYQFHTTKDIAPIQSCIARKLFENSRPLLAPRWNNGNSWRLHGNSGPQGPGCHPSPDTGSSSWSNRLHLLSLRKQNNCILICHIKFGYGYKFILFRVVYTTCSSLSKIMSRTKLSEGYCIFQSIIWLHIFVPLKFSRLSENIIMTGSDSFQKAFSEISFDFCTWAGVKMPGYPPGQKNSPGVPRDKLPPYFLENQWDLVLGNLLISHQIYGFFHEIHKKLIHEVVSYTNKQYSCWLLLACGKAFYCCARAVQ